MKPGWAPIWTSGWLKSRRSLSAERRRICEEGFGVVRKRTQPLESPSAGCIFINPDPARDKVPEGIPPSAGALVDRAGLKGAALGGARVSATHANFIINDGSAKAGEIHQLVEQCRGAVKDQFDVTLRNEIICMGDF